MDRLISEKKFREAEVNSCYQNFKNISKGAYKKFIRKKPELSPWLVRIKTYCQIILYTWIITFGFVKDNTELYLLFCVVVIVIILIFKQGYYANTTVAFNRKISFSIPSVCFERDLNFPAF
jgi:hypothetical protein